MLRRTRGSRLRAWVDQSGPSPGPIEFSTAVSAQSEIVASLSISRSLGALVADASTITADLTDDSLKALNATVQAENSVSAALAVKRGFSAAVAAVNAISVASTTVRRGLNATISATDTVAGAARVKRALAGTVADTNAVSASLTVTGGGGGYSWSLTAGADPTVGQVFGYDTNSFGLGAYGSINAEPLPGHAMLACVTNETLLNRWEIRFNGNAVALLTGKVFYVGGLAYPADLSDWTYDGGSDYTAALGSPPLPWDSAGGTYACEIK